MCLCAHACLHAETVSAAKRTHVRVRMWLCLVGRMVHKPARGDQTVMITTEITNRTTSTFDPRWAPWDRRDPPSQLSPGGMTHA